MAKLTDEKVAKALGWRKIVQRDPGKRGKVYIWRLIEFKDNGRKGEAVYKFRECYPKGVYGPPVHPRYTTSLDAIVAEIEARNMGWSAHRVLAFGPRACEAQVGAYKVYGHTPALALCAALLQFLKDQK